MFSYILRRILQSIPVVLLVTIGAFSVIVLVPGDPAQHMLGYNATPESLRILREQLGLDRSISQQFWDFFRGVVVGDFGESILKKESVRTVVGERAIVSLFLLGYAVLVALLISIPIAIVSALRKNRWPDHILRLTSMVTFAMPSFWLGLLLALWFGLYLGWFPVGGYNDASIFKAFHTLTLPAVTVGLYLAPLLARSLRSSLIEELDRDYVDAARARGFTESRVVGKHVLRNSLISTVTVLSLNVGYLLSGTVIVENVFAIPGLGTLIVDAVMQRDYPLIQALTLFFGVAVIATNLLADLSYAVLDPRIRLSGKR
jgi:peptide/nickel transport system permease protein